MKLIPSMSGLRACIEDLPQDFIVSAIRALVRANRDAVEMCAGLDPAQRVDVFGHIERAFFEKSLKEVARATEGATAKDCHNESGTSHHVEVSIGGVLITSSAVSYPREMPRSAHYRNSLAQSGQQSLLALLGLDDRSEEAPRIHVILTHCTDAKLKVCDVRLLVPNHTGRKRLWWRELNTELNDAWHDICGDAPEEEVPEAELRLKKKERRDQGEE